MKFSSWFVIINLFYIVNKFIERLFTTIQSSLKGKYFSLYKCSCLLRWLFIHVLELALSYAHWWLHCSKTSLKKAKNFKHVLFSREHQNYISISITYNILPWVALLHLPTRNNLHVICRKLCKQILLGL